ncbi:hypothetical protein ACFLW1_02585 [Chloroflexota bacterium]
MEISQIAKLLQIGGILIGTGLGTILLNPEILGETAHRINAKFLSLGSNITERYSKVLRFIVPGGVLAPAVTQAISSSMVIFGAWAILLIALQKDVIWIVWVGAIIIGFYVLLAIVDTIIRIVTGFPRRYPFWLYPILLLIRLVSGLFIFPIVVIILIFANYLLLTIAVIFRAIAGKGIIRRGLIISGFVLVLAGLILEFIIPYIQE